MRSVVIVVFMLACASLSLVALEQSGVESRLLPRSTEGAGALPAPFLKVLALEYDGLAADLIFVDALVFYGEAMERTTKPRMQDWEWKWLFKTFETAVEIDPLFYEPYYFANALFPWEGKLIREVDDLLERGAMAREWDWTLPFYAGFNEFYFLQNNEKAAELLMLAANRPGAMPILSTLATRLAYRGNQTENAIRFLNEIIQTMDDSAERRQYETRLEALKGVYVREMAAKAYKDMFNHPPLSLEELFFLELISSFTSDPYGGIYYFAPDGTVKTTSDLRPMK